MSIIFKRMFILVFLRRWHIAYRMKEFVNFDLPLKLITSTASNVDDISSGSYVGRTVNLFYLLMSQHTSHISFRLVTFKKEYWYGPLIFRPFQIWKNIKLTYGVVIN